VRQRKTGQPVRFELTEHTVRRSTPISRPPARRQVSSSSSAIAVPTEPSRLGSMRGWYPNGLPELGSTQAFLAPLPAPNQGDAHLPTDWKPACRATPSTYCPRTTD
jgi:hypothetical protein